MDGSSSSRCASKPITSPKHGTTQCLGAKMLPFLLWPPTLNTTWPMLNGKPFTNYDAQWNKLALIGRNLHSTVQTGAQQYKLVLNGLELKCS